MINEYELFLIDSRLQGLIPSKLGQLFLKRKRIPAAIELFDENLIEKNLVSSF